MHSEKRLYLVFEYLDLDLKKHMDLTPDFSKDLHMIKVSAEKLLGIVLFMCLIQFYAKGIFTNQKPQLLLSYRAIWLVVMP